MALHHLLKQLSPVRDTEEQLRSHILWLLFIRVVLFTLLLGITYLLKSRDSMIILPPPFIILTFILLIYGYSIGSAVLLQVFVTRLQRFGLIQLLSDTVFMSLLVYATGCSQSIYTSIYILPIIAGGLILYRIGGLITAAAATLLYGGILVLEYMYRIPRYFFEGTRYIPVDDFLVGMNAFAVYGLTFFLIALLSGMLAQRLRTTEDALTRTEIRLDQLFLLYKQIFDDIVTGIITVDDQDRITSFNPAAEDITGYSQEELLGTSLSKRFPELSVVCSERHVANLEKKDGTATRVGFSCSGLHFPMDPEKTEDHGANCKVITLQDISKVEIMERQVRRAEKMAAIGEMSASIAHDFRNPLAAISGSAQLLDVELASRDYEATAPPSQLTKIILRESERMAATITDFLDYARPGTPVPDWFNLHKLCAETVNLVLEQNFPTCRIEAVIPETLDIRADRQLLHLALTHLLKNSCHASRNTSSPVAITAVEDVKANQIIIEVQDHGEGFPEEVGARLIEPFFTTREDTAGLGLAIVNQIVSAHDGELTITGGRNLGCTARIILPLPESAPH